MKRQYTIRRNGAKFTYLVEIDGKINVWGERKYAIGLTIQKAQKIRDSLDWETSLERW